MKPILFAFTFLALIFPALATGQTMADLGNQELAALGLVDVTAAPFNADPTGVADSSDAINAALVFGRENHMVTYLPAGDYKVSQTIRLSGRNKSDPDSDMDEYFCVLQGETGVAGKRSRLMLAPDSPGYSSRNPVAIVVHAYFPDGSGYNTTGHYNQVVRSLDIVIGDGNSGAVGLRMQGAEGCLIDDVTVDATHGWKGVWGIPGSGGSTHKLTVIGGEIGIDLRGYNDNGAVSGVGTQPGPSISQLRLIDQTVTPLALQTRGALVIAGAEIVSGVAQRAFTLQGLGSNNPWASSLALVDATVDLTGTGAARSLVEQAGFPGRGYTLHNVFVRGVSTLDSASGLTAAPAVWTHFRELAVAVPPVPYQGNILTEPIMVDGQVIAANHLLESEPGRAPDMDFVAYHGYGQVLPIATDPDVVNILDFGADPAGVADSTEALRQAIAAGRDVLVPKGTFMISDTVYLKSDTRLFGIHPILSLLRASDTPSARFAGLSEGDEPAPMVVSPDDKAARTVISMLGLEVPKAVRSHRRDPVLAYSLKWQSGRRSLIHHSQFDPYAAVNWRLQNVMGSDFQLAQETGNYINGGLQFSSNDILGRMFMESLGGSVRMTMPFVKGGTVLTIARSDGGAFSLSQFELGKATFRENPAFAVTIRGTRMDNSIVEETANFGTEWTDRESFTTVSPDWTNLKRVVLSAPQPFSLDNVVSSQGTADMEKRRPFYVTVACEDMRMGFEHFPFAPITHPQVLVTGNGGGRWYNNFHHGDLWCYPEFAFIMVRDTTEPLNIYNWHLQHVHSDSQAVFRNAHFVNVFGFKSEHNSRFLSVYDSNHIRLFGWAGLADAAVGSSHFYFENTPNFLHAALAEEPHFISTPEVWSICDNPLVVHDVSLFDGIQELFGAELFSTPELGRTILYKRGQPISPVAPASYAEWADIMGLEGLDADPAADPTGTGIPNLLQYALRMEASPWLGDPLPLAIVYSDSSWVVRVPTPANRSDVYVNLFMANAPGDRAGATTVLLDPFRLFPEPDGTVSIPFPFELPAFSWLEAEMNL